LLIDLWIESLSRDILHVFRHQNGLLQCLYAQFTVILSQTVLDCLDL
jgi:hypothetical protein